MSTPHVYFADMQEYEGIANNNNINNNNNKKKLATEMEHLQLQSHNSNGSASSSLSVSPIPRYERNMGFFRQLSRRFGLRSNDDDDLLQMDDALNAVAVAAASAIEDDANSSSTDSCYSGLSAGVGGAVNSCSISASAQGIAAHIQTLNNAKDNQHGSSVEHMSCASSETSSTIDSEEQQQQQQRANQIKRKSSTRASFSLLQRRSTSSLRRAFENLSLTSRSLSCSGPSPPPTANTTSTADCREHRMPLKSALKSASTVDLHKHRCTSATCCGTAISSTSANSLTACNKLSKSNKSNKSKTQPQSQSQSQSQPQRILRQPVSYTYLKGMSGLPTQRVPRNSVCCQYAARR